MSYSKINKEKKPVKIKNRGIIEIIQIIRRYNMENRQKSRKKKKNDCRVLTTQKEMDILESHEYRGRRVLMSKITILDIALEAGVSKSTVSRVLNLSLIHV